MRKILLCLFVALSLSAAAKDVIMFSDGQSVDAIVLSVGQSDISYKRADNPNGPTYTVPTSKVFYITYENGEKEIVNDLSKSQPSKSPSELMKKNNEKLLREEEERVRWMGKNSIRFRFGSGVQFGSWNPGGDMAAYDFIGASLPELDIMWLHSIYNYTGNFGVGLGVNNLIGSPDDDIDITATYLTIPMQLQYVSNKGFTFAGILTPAILINGDGSTNWYEFDEEAFAKFRFGIGFEFGYNYHRWDFGVRGTMWIGNVLSGLSSSLDYNLGVSVGYRLRLN